MKVLWSLEALQDRQAIWNYLFQESPKAAVHVDGLFDDAARRLEIFPESGRLGLISGTRELIPHESYRLVYEIQAETVWILALVHTSRQWPPVSS